MGVAWSQAKRMTGSALQQNSHRWSTDTFLIRVTRTWFLFFSVWQYCMQVNICLTARLYLSLAIFLQCVHILAAATVL